jgi:hypothetical protein
MSWGWNRKGAGLKEEFEISNLKFEIFVFPCAVRLEPLLIDVIHVLNELRPGTLNWADY